MRAHACSRRTARRLTDATRWNEGFAAGAHFYWRVIASAPNGGATVSSPPWRDFSTNSMPGVTGVETLPGTIPAAPAFAVGRPAPNPSDGETSLTFSLPVSTPVTLDVFDVQGRHVRELIHATIPAGIRTVQWDGKDAHIGPAASGLYFTRLSTPERTEVRRVILLP